MWMLIGISCHLVYSHLFDISNAWLVGRFFISLYLDVTSTKQRWCQYFLKETARALMFKLTSTRRLMDYKFDTSIHNLEWGVALEIRPKMNQSRCWYIRPKMNKSRCWYIRGYKDDQRIETYKIIYQLVS